MMTDAELLQAEPLARTMAWDAKDGNYARAAHDGRTLLAVRPSWVAVFHVVGRLLADQ